VIAVCPALCTGPSITGLEIGVELINLDTNARAAQFTEQIDLDQSTTYNGTQQFVSNATSGGE